MQEVHADTLEELTYSSFMNPDMLRLR
jgi:hypothetical protein